MSSPVLRQARAEDGPAIRQLLADVLPGNPKCDADVMDWQYEGNRSGRAISWVWEDGDRIVSHCARLPVRALVSGQPATVVASVDAATAASHQRAGLYDRMRDAQFDVCRSQGIRVALTALGPQTRVPRVDADSGVPIDVFVLPVDLKWAASRLRLPRPAAAGLRLLFRGEGAAGGRERERCPDDIGDLWAELADRFPFGTIRDEDWWRWRFDAHPHAPYRYFEVRDAGRLRAAAVVRAGEFDGAPIVRVLELLAATDREARALTTVIAAASPDAVALTMLTTSCGASADAVRWAGFRRVPRRFDPAPLAWFARDTTTNGFWPPSTPWTVTWGDMDYL